MLFRSQAETLLDSSVSDALVARFGNSLSRLTNPASVFLLIATELVSDRGVVTMIQPASFLATRESAEIRSMLVRGRTLSDLWVGGSKIFDAAVEVVGISLTRTTLDVPTRISVGRNFKLAAVVRPPTIEDKTWSYLLARAKGVPACAYESGGVVGDIASATADFRDQYYGLVGVVREAGSSDAEASQMRLATVGLIDLGEFLWGQIGRAHV